MGCHLLGLLVLFVFLYSVPKCCARKYGLAGPFLLNAWTMSFIGFRLVFYPSLII